MAIRIDFLSNTREFLKGATDVDGALDKVGGSLDGLASDTKATSTKIGEDFQGSAVKIEKSFKEMAAEAKAQIGSVTSSVRRGEREQTQTIELSAREQKKLRREALKQTADQAKAVAAQSASSIDGTLSGLTSAVSGASIGVLASLPPQFAAAGAAGIAALGLIGGALARNDESTQQFRQDVADLAGELIKAGENGTLSIGDIESALEKLAIETDSNKVSLSKLFDTSRSSGNSFKDLAQAYAGNTSRLKELLAASKDKLKVDQAAADATRVSRADQDSSTAGSIKAAAALRAQAGAQQDYVAYLQQAADKAKAAKKEQEQFAAAGGFELELKAGLVDQLGKSYEDAAGDLETYLNKETGIYDVAAYIAAMTARQKALNDYEANLASSALSPEAKKFLESQGADAAATFLAGYEGASADQKSQLNQIWTEAGKASAGDYADALTKNLPATVKGPAVTVDTSGAEAQLAGLGRGKSIVLKTTFVDRNGRPLP